ncbi:hypothetical protein LIER_31628 [Lithospermum erythrorhizon]|uniref:Uncharacterized protein n=1 Tax=Lithospermum erythrorhizon TaxID=34254 RepID=A0AAV3RV46_LITER
MSQNRNLTETEPEPMGTDRIGTDRNRTDLVNQYIHIHNIYSSSPIAALFLLPLSPPYSSSPYRRREPPPRHHIKG